MNNDEQDSINPDLRVCCAGGTFQRQALLNCMRFVSFMVLILLTANSVAMDANKVMQSLLHDHRVLIIFTPAADQEHYAAQNTILAQQPAGLDERDMVIIRVVAPDTVTMDGDRAVNMVNSFQERYAVKPDQFRTVLVGKDGSVKLEQSTPVTTDTLFNLIDAMPMRQYEMLKQ